MVAVLGGAWDWPDNLDGGKDAGLRTALKIGYDVLHAGGSALDAVESAVRSLEDDPVFDGGYGGYLSRDGVVQLDALIIDRDGRFSAAQTAHKMAHGWMSEHAAPHTAMRSSDA